MDDIKVQYIGEQTHLLGHTAMVSYEGEDFFEVQFDSLGLVTMMSFPKFQFINYDDGYWSLRAGEICFPIHMAYGQHRFKKDQFIVIERQTAEDTARFRADAERLRSNSES